MTVAVPDSRPDLLPPDGDPAGVDALARLLFATAARYDDVAHIARAGRADDGDWAGTAYASYLAATRRAAAEHDRLAGAVRRVARTCTVAADTLTELVALYRRLVADKTAYDARRAGLLEEAAAGPPDEDLRRRARALARDYAALVEEHQRLHQRREDTEQLLLRAFAGTTTLASILSGPVDPVARTALARAGAPGGPGGPTAVRAWWDGLSAAERSALLAGCPRLIGGAAGLPARVRDRANRITLADYLAELRRRDADGTLTASDRRRLATARATDRALERVDATLDPVTGEPAGGFLWLFDPGAHDGEGRVGVAVGDLDAAADVAVRVPGLGNGGASIDDLTADAAATYAAARAAGDRSSVASLAWAGYDAPDGLRDDAAYSLGRAEEGGDALAADLDALVAGRPTDPHLTVIGHSYGSAVAGQALAHHAPPVDDAVLLGSPGVGVDHADGLGLGAGQVWVGAASDDPVTWVHPLGPDPARDDFGAVRLRAEDPAAGGLWSTDRHGAYFDPGSESLTAVGHVVDGTTDALLPAEPRHEAAYSRPVDGSGRTVTAHHVVDPEARRVD